jgi:transcriptional regulator with XRE-family HTH domain
MPGKKELGEALRLLRSRLGLAQKELAYAAKITRGMMSGYERGQTRPTLVSLNKVLNALGADLCDLYCAVEMVHGRPANAHGLSARFQPGTETPPRSAPVKPADRPAPARQPEPGPEGGGTEPQLPADLVHAVHTILRYALPGLSGPR